MRAARAMVISAKTTNTTRRIVKNAPAPSILVHPTLRVTPSTDKTFISAPGSSAEPSCCASSARHSSEPILTRPQSRGAMRLVTTPVRPMTASTFDACVLTCSFDFSHLRKGRNTETARIAVESRPMFAEPKTKADYATGNERSADQCEIESRDYASASSAMTQITQE